MSQYDKFYTYLAELNTSQQRLAGLLVSKLEAVQGFDLNRLDEIIKEEQVYVLVSKSFDNNIDKYRKELSLSGERLSEIIEELPTEEQQRFRDLLKELKTSLDASQELNEKCQALLEERLYSLNKQKRELDKNSGATYNKESAGTAGTDGPRILSKSI